MLKHIAVLIAFTTVLTMPAMAQNAGQISKVKSGKSCPGCNLFQADLAYKDSAGLNLSKSRLRQADLALVTYDRINFAGSNLSVTNLFGARFNKCNFSGANLQGASAVGTYFGSSNLTGANLSGANLSGADLSIARGLNQTQLNAACGDHTTRLPTGKTIPACR